MEYLWNIYGISMEYLCNELYSLQVLIPNYRHVQTTYYISGMHYHPLVLTEILQCQSIYFHLTKGIFDSTLLSCFRDHGGSIPAIVDGYPPALLISQFSTTSSPSFYGRLKNTLRVSENP